MHCVWFCKLNDKSIFYPLLLLPLIWRVKRNRLSDENGFTAGTEPRNVTARGALSIQLLRSRSSVPVLTATAIGDTHGNALWSRTSLSLGSCAQICAFCAWRRNLNYIHTFLFIPLKHEAYSLLNHNMLIQYTGHCCPFCSATGLLISARRAVRAPRKKIRTYWA